VPVLSNQLIAQGVDRTYHVDVPATTKSGGAPAMTPAIPGPAAGPVPRSHIDGRTLEAVLLAGLAGVFLVNALVAVLQPSDFTGLVDRSLLGRWFPAFAGSWVVWANAINDLSLGLCLVAATWSRRARPYVLAWAGIWLFVVTVIKVTSLHAFGG
jgi:hypothetical protein